MRLLKRFRAAKVIRLAGALIDRHSQLRRGHAEGHQPPRSSGRAIVQDHWHRTPELAAARRTPTPVLLAAGALAAAIETAECDGDAGETEALHSTLLLLWICERDRIAPLHELSGFDRRLFHQARSILRVSWVVNFD